MSEFTVVVVQDLKEVSTTQEEKTVQISPASDSVVEVVQPVSEVAVSEQAVYLDIIQSPAYNIEIIESVDGGCCDLSNVDIPALTLTKIYSETISALKLVTASGPTTVKVGTPDTFENAKIMGVALQGGITGFAGRVHILGILEDPAFNFPVNSDLYLGSSGEITDLAPSTSGEYSINVGYSLGTGAIFIKIGEPILLS